MTRTLVIVHPEPLEEIAAKGSKRAVEVTRSIRRLCSAYERAGEQVLIVPEGQPATYVHPDLPPSGRITVCGAFREVCVAQQAEARKAQGYRVRICASASLSSEEGRGNWYFVDT